MHAVVLESAPEWSGHVLLTNYTSEGGGSIGAIERHVWPLLG